MNMKHFSYLLAIWAFPLCSVAADTHATDTLGFDVTFIGDREVLLRDAHKEMHWPQPARIERTKPAFEYGILPNRLNVEPTWERQGPKRLKIEEPLPRLYRGYTRVGMGNYLRPTLLVNFTDLRSRQHTWGTALQHESTRGGFAPMPGVTVETPQAFSQNALEGWYKRFLPHAVLSGSTKYQRNHLSYYGRVNNLVPIDSTPFPLGDSTTYSAWHSRVEFHQNDAAGRSWTQHATVDYGLLWSDRNVTEHNLDVRLKTLGDIEGTPIQLLFHTNIDRLKRQEEGLIVAPQKQAIFDLHPTVRKQFKGLTTQFGFGMWVDAQGTRPFVFVPELEASVGLLQNLFVPYLGLNGGVLQNRYETALGQNPFIPALDTTTVWRNTYEGFRATAGMRGSITSAIAFELKAEFAQRDQQLFWAAADPYSSGSAFRAHYQDLGISTLSANATWQLTSRTSLAGEIQQHSYTFRDSAVSELAAWNLPQVEIRVQAQHTVKEKLKLTTDLEILNGRRGLNAAGIDETTAAVIANSIDGEAASVNLGFASDLSDYVAWNAQVEYVYNSRLSAWLSGENLLNRSNPIWAGYNSQGIRFQLGFNYAF